MGKNVSQQKTKASTLYQSIFDLEASINSLCWGCQALSIIMADNTEDRIDSATWICDSLQNEAKRLQSTYKALFDQVRTEAKS